MFTGPLDPLTKDIARVHGRMRETLLIEIATDRLDRDQRVPLRLLAGQLNETGWELGECRERRREDIMGDRLKAEIAAELLIREVATERLDRFPLCWAERDEEEERKISPRSELAMKARPKVLGRVPVKYPL